MRGENENKDGSGKKEEEKQVGEEKSGW